MATAKKVIKAEIDLASIERINGSVDVDIPADGTAQEIQAYFQEKYGSAGSGQLQFAVHNGVVKFTWTLSKVVPEAEHLHKEALAKARAHAFKEAAEHWIRAVALNPEDPDYYFNAGIAFYEVKNYKEAVENLEYAIKLCPIYFKAQLILGTVYLKTRKFAQAEAHLKESIHFNPNNSLAILNLGAVYSILKKYDEGILAFKRIIEISPDEPRAYFGLGKIFSIQGRIQEANECFRKVIEFDKKGDLATHAKRAIISDQSSTAVIFKKNNKLPEIEEAHLEDFYAEGYKAFLFGDYSRSGDLYRKYIEYKPKDDNVWYALGESYLRAGYAKEAAVAFRNAIKLSSNKGLYYKQLAVAYDFLSQAGKALNAIEQAVALGKKDSIVYTIWGKNLIKVNRLQEAVEKLESAVKLNKVNMSAAYHLALAYAKMNESNKAVEYLHAILNSKIKSPIKAEAEMLLNKVK